MSLKWYFRNDDGDIVEMVQRVAVMHSPNPGTDGLVTNAEEGSVGRSQIRVDDPDGTFSIRGHRRVMAIEQEALADDFNGLVWFGFSFTQTVQEGSPFDGVGRVWTVDLDDLNTAFERRIMNSGANRPEETDVERIQWLLTTSQANLIDDDTLVSTDDPVDMDACDYRGQKLRDVFDDCAQQSGKNWYLVHLGTDAGTDVLFSPWYGHGSLDEYDSGVTITNDPAAIAADVDGLTFPPSADTKLRRDPSRVFSGVWMDYDGGDVFVTRPATAVAFAIAGRDTNAQAMNVKTATKATARANKYLGSIKTQEEVIETAIVVPAEKVNCVVHGHQVDVKVSWMPGYDVLTTGRVLNATKRQIGTSTYEIALEIAVEPAPAESAPAGPATLYAAGDNGVIFYINGVEVGNNAGGDHEFPRDIADGILVTGDNVLAMHVENGSSPATWDLGNPTFIETRLFPEGGVVPYVWSTTAAKTWDVENDGGTLDGEPTDWTEADFDDSGWADAVDVTDDPLLTGAAPISPARLIAPGSALAGGYGAGLIWLVRMNFTIDP